MLKDIIISISLITNVTVSTLAIAPTSSIIQKEEEQILAKREMDLTTRMANEYGNQVFSDNILLNLHYIKGDVGSLKIKDGVYGPQNITWQKVREPFEVSFVLRPDEVFAYHENVLPEYKESVALTTNSHFNYADGYKALNGLSGNGVCHLASFINWTAKEAGLQSVSYVNHDFSPIPDVPREYGASIYYSPDGARNTAKQNLYIKNNLEMPVKFEFKADADKVVLTIVK